MFYAQQMKANHIKPLYAIKVYSKNIKNIYVWLTIIFFMIGMIIYSLYLLFLSLFICESLPQKIPRIEGVSTPSILCIIGNFFRFILIILSIFVSFLFLPFVYTFSMLTNIVLFPCYAVCDKISSDNVK